MKETDVIGATHRVLGIVMAWVAVDTATIDAAVTWPKWLLVPMFAAFGFGFLVSALRAGTRSGQPPDAA